MEDFWQDLKKEHPTGIFGLSPMDGVTDLAMRLMTAKYSQPDIMMTEFVNVEGWTKGAEVLRKQLWHQPEEGQVIAQLYGLQPANFQQTILETKENGFSGFDLNMGCPAKNVALNGAGAGLIKNRPLAKEIFLAAKGAAGELPVSIKTRIGFEREEVEDWIGWILTELKPKCLTIHGRTYRQGYTGQANWEAIKKAVELRDRYSPQTILLGNGDIKNMTQAQEAVEKYGVDGILIGRAAMGQPEIFLKKNNQPANFADLALEHAQLYEELYNQEEKYSFLPMRKHLAWYVKGVPDAAKIRAALCQTNSSQEVYDLLQKYR